MRVISDAPGEAVRRLAGLIRRTGSRDELSRYLGEPDEGVVTNDEV